MSRPRKPGFTGGHLITEWTEESVKMKEFTFEEFVDYGKTFIQNNGGNLVNGMPWSFSFIGYPVTHENDECYLISTLDDVYRFTPKDVLKIYPDSVLIVMEKFTNSK